jgi:hypothetical protein
MLGAFSSVDPRTLAMMTKGFLCVSAEWLGVGARAVTTSRRSASLLSPPYLTIILNAVLISDLFELNDDDCTKALRSLQ